MYDPTPWSQSERRAYAKGVEKGSELADESALERIAKAMETISLCLVNIEMNTRRNH